MQMSEELAALTRRAEAATAAAHPLLDENERWRRRAERQLDCLLELGAELTRPAVSHLRATLPRPPVADK